MTSYGTSGAFDSHWQTPPPDSAHSFIEPSYDDPLLDVFQSNPFQAYDTAHNSNHSAYGQASQRVASGQDGSIGAYSEAASSPQGSLSYASSTGYSTAGSSFAVGPGSGMDFDLNSLFTAPNGGGSSLDGDSPPFDFGNSLSCDFDTTGLQALFSQQSSGQAQYVQPFTGLSPASTMSNGNSPPHMFPLGAYNNYQLQYPNTAQAHPSQPQQYLAPSNPSMPNHPPPVRNPSISSSASPSALSPVSLSEQDIAVTKRRRVTLAETAGLGPTSMAHPSSSIAPALFAVRPELYAPVEAIGQRQPQVVSSGVSGRKVKAKSPVELIANAGIAHSGVYNPPTYQLLPKPVESTTSNGAAGKGKRGASSLLSASTAEDKSGPGGKRKKVAERGHNAVEQKYRNSINNALATLRDTIPALRHLKPLPSMPVSKRKASQFSLPSSVASVAPTGLVDGVPAAKTLSKGVILNKAIEYIDYLRFSRESNNEDLEMLKEMVRTRVGGGDQLVGEFEKQREEREAERAKERENEREDGEGEDDGSGEGEADEEDEEEKTAPAVAKAKRATAAPKKRGAPKKDTAPAARSKSMASAGGPDATISLPSQQISPPLTSEYRHVQALNAAHLDSIAASSHLTPSTHTFPPSPVSSDDHSVSPAAVGGDLGQLHGYGGQPPRVLLASFMGLSFAGGVGYDWSSGAAAAAGEASEVVASAWTSRLARRSLTPTSRGTIVDLVHPSLLSGLVALGLASIVISLAFVVIPLLRPPPPSSKAESRRSRALSSLASVSASDTAPSTYASARFKALAARQELLRLANAPSLPALPLSLLKEAVTWFLGSRFGIDWHSAKSASHSAEELEEAVAWIRIAEIEATVGTAISTLPRLYTFFRLSNLARSPSWPQISASTSLPAVTALLSTHLLSSGHDRWAESLWRSISSQRKKRDSTASTSDSFVEVALDADFETVRHLLGDSRTTQRSDDEPSVPRDTVPLLEIAETVCLEALEDVWTRIFTTIVDSTCPPHRVGAVPSKAKLQPLIKNEDLEETLGVVYRISVPGSEIRSLALMTRAVLDMFSVGETDNNQSVAKACIGSLLAETKQGGPFSRFASAAPFCQLLIPSLSTDLIASFPSIDQAATSVDHLAATTLSWLVVRRQSLELWSERAAYPSPPPSPTTTSPTLEKVNLATHSQALAIRRLLSHDIFRHFDADQPDKGSIDFEEATDLLVDALTALARRAAGLGSRDDDSGVEL